MHCTFFTLESQRDHFNVKKKIKILILTDFFITLKILKKKKGKGDFNKNQEYSLLEIFYNKMENIKKNDA